MAIRTFLFLCGFISYLGFGCWFGQHRSSMGDWRESKNESIFFQARMSRILEVGLLGFGFDFALLNLF